MIYAWNVEGLFLSVLLHAWAQACVCNLYLCVRNFVLAYTSLFLRLCVCGFCPVYVGSYLCMWALTHVRETPGRGLTLPIFTSFLTVSLLYATLTPLFWHFCTWTSLHPSFYLYSYIKNIIFHHFHLNPESCLLLLQSTSPYTGRRSTNKVVEWYNLLVPKTRAYIGKWALSLSLSVCQKGP